ncbi:MAG: RluA family pseudouridine synthase [Candidatus Euphemobacter frigidus]|nr:RluA family pseudouridine synthase [Candidatus Euphemobacter frigidus]MDP8276633.1 RluA family pseudouridine synthase [Candidatus Euphemobacter frigidus]
MSKRREFQVREDEGGLRQDLFLVRRLPEYSRNRIKELIENGLVLVSGRHLKPHHPLSPGDLVEVDLPLSPRLSPDPEPIPLDIIYEDESIIVLNKPPGLLVHPVREGQGGTLVNALLFHAGRLSNVGGILRPGIVHRLDRDTSGVMVAAKNDQAHAELTRQFKDRMVGKEYLAVVRGVPPAVHDQITYPLGRTYRRRTRMTVRYLVGREARTEYDVLERFKDFSFLRLVIKTGRTHQIRVHLSRLGCPVLGDKEYGTRSGKGDRVMRAPRQMLHAHRLRFLHPLTREPMEFIAPLPEDMEEILALLRKDKDKR